jgi:D-glycero-D-manno-heptose 1,7-bisphosphate phosphatase
MSVSSALFLDRDGTLIVHKPYLHKVAEVELLPGVVPAIRTLMAAGTRLFLLTNQSGVGRGWFSMADVEAVHGRMIELIGLGPDIFSAICVAPEGPEQPSRYRKPSPRFIREQIAAWALDPASCWMVGDTPSDWKSGLGAGISALAVRSDLTTPQTEAERTRLAVPLFSDLLEAVNHILRKVESKS